jgi:hypothetical protein
VVETAGIVYTFRDLIGDSQAGTYHFRDRYSHYAAV